MSGKLETEKIPVATLLREVEEAMEKLLKFLKTKDVCGLKDYAATLDRLRAVNGVIRNKALGGIDTIEFATQEQIRRYLLMNRVTSVRNWLRRREILPEWTHGGSPRYSASKIRAADPDRRRSSRKIVKDS